MYYTASTGVYTEGFVVRQESVIPAGYDLVLPTKAEGEKVAAGEQVALSFRTTAALERQEEIQALENSIQQLETALGYQTSLTDGDAVAQRIMKWRQNFLPRRPGEFGCGGGNRQHPKIFGTAPERRSRG